jgi:hypothetical protein
MKWIATFIMLTTASALIGCASQAPGISTATTTGQANAATTSTGTATGQAATSTRAVSGQASAGASAPAASQQVKTEVLVHAAKLTVGADWRPVVLNGEEVYCQKRYALGSRAETQVVCVTKERLQQMQTSGQRYLESVERMDGVNPGSPNMGGANMGGR